MSAASFFRVTREHLVLPLSPTAKLVYFVIGLHSWREQSVIRMAEFEACTGASSKAIRRALAELERGGWIVVDRRTYHAVAYRQATEDERPVLRARAFAGANGGRHIGIVANDSEPEPADDIRANRTDDPVETHRSSGQNAPIIGAKRTDRNTDSFEDAGRAETAFSQVLHPVKNSTRSVDLIDVADRARACANGEPHPPPLDDPPEPREPMPDGEADDRPWWMRATDGLGYDDPIAVPDVPGLADLDDDEPALRREDVGREGGAPGVLAWRGDTGRRCGLIEVGPDGTLVERPLPRREPAEGRGAPSPPAAADRRPPLDRDAFARQVYATASAVALTLGESFRYDEGRAALARKHRLFAPGVVEISRTLERLHDLPSAGDLLDAAAWLLEQISCGRATAKLWRSVWGYPEQLARALERQLPGEGGGYLAPTIPYLGAG